MLDYRSKLIVIQRLCLQASEILSIPMVTILLLASIGLVFMVAGKVEVALMVARNIRQAHDVIGQRPWLEPCRAELEEVRRLTPPKTCEPRQTLVFVKTHRTGSSTIQNVFLRYGDKHNLTFAFPPQGNYFWSPKDIPQDLYPAPGHKFDIFCFHTVLDKHDLKSIMNPKSTWITVMGDPRRVFESMYRYFGMQHKRFFNITFEQFLEDPPPPEGRHKSLLYGSNQMALDLGMSVHHFHIPNRVKVYVEYMEETFSLVMIAEKMDESMVLLRHEMCWDIPDMVAFHINARFNKKSTDTLAALSEKQTKNLDLVTFADRSLYSKFRGIFDQRLASFGEDRMEAEKRALKCVRERMKEVCRVKTLKASFIHPYGMYQPYGPALGFIPDPDPAFKSHPEFDWLCKAMSYTEEKYIDLLREKQRGMHRPELFTAAGSVKNRREKKRNEGP